MGKLLTRLFVIILLGLVVYLYVQVVDLQRTNKALEVRMAQYSALQSQNSDLKARLAKRETRETPTGSPVDWIGSARTHVRLAEEAAAKGNFGEATRQTKFANLALSRAADEASTDSRLSVKALQNQVQDLQTKANSVWRRFGG